MKNLTGSILKIVSIIVLFTSCTLSSIDMDNTAEGSLIPKGNTNQNVSYTELTLIPQVVSKSDNGDQLVDIYFDGNVNPETGTIIVTLDNASEVKGSVGDTIRVVISMGGALKSSPSDEGINYETSWIVTGSEKGFRIRIKDFSVIGLGIKNIEFADFKDGANLYFQPVTIDESSINSVTYPITYFSAAQYNNESSINQVTVSYNSSIDMAANGTNILEYTDGTKQYVSGNLNKDYHKITMVATSGKVVKFVTLKGWKIYANGGTVTLPISDITLPVYTYKPEVSFELYGIVKDVAGNDKLVGISPDAISGFYFKKYRLQIVSKYADEINILVAGVTNASVALYNLPGYDSMKTYTNKVEFYTPNTNYSSNPMKYSFTLQAKNKLLPQFNVSLDKSLYVKDGQSTVTVHAKPYTAGNGTLLDVAGYTYQAMSEKTDAGNKSLILSNAVSASATDLFSEEVYITNYGRGLYVSIVTPSINDVVYSIFTNNSYKVLETKYNPDGTVVQKVKYLVGQIDELTQGLMTTYNFSYKNLPIEGTDLKYKLNYVKNTGKIEKETYLSIINKYSIVRKLDRPDNCVGVQLVDTVNGKYYSANKAIVTKGQILSFKAVVSDTKKYPALAQKIDSKSGSDLGSKSGSVFSVTSLGDKEVTFNLQVKKGATIEATVPYTVVSLDKYSQWADDYTPVPVTYAGYVFGGYGANMYLESIPIRLDLITQAFKGEHFSVTPLAQALVNPNVTVVSDNISYGGWFGEITIREIKFKIRLYDPGYMYGNISWYVKVRFEQAPAANIGPNAGHGIVQENYQQ
ncbi:MAG: hypothetical protein HPY53_01190 [Brevinematales bacterium]|nr:hypothetical protein [Brevinematales bacterium]